MTVKGSTKPIGLFTYDVDVEGLESMRIKPKAVSDPLHLLCAAVCSGLLRS